MGFSTRGEDWYANGLKVSVYLPIASYSSP